jgi:hypothetical protein
MREAVERGMDAEGLSFSNVGVDTDLQRFSGEFEY